MNVPRLAVIGVAVNAAAAIVSVRERLPAEWGRGFAGPLAVSGRRDKVLVDFLSWRGTAIAPPLPVMAALAGLAALSARGSRRALAGLAGTTGAGLAGYFGEPLVRRLLTPAGAQPGKTALVASSIALYAAIFAGGVRHLRRDSLTGEPA